MGTRLEHANLTVRDLESALRFLQTAAPDWRVRHRAEGDRKWVHFGDDRTYLALEEAREEGELQSGEYLRPDINHLGLVVDDLEAATARLLGAGYREGIQTTDHPHRRRKYFYDDDGFEWELLEYLSEDPASFNDYSE